MASNLKQQAIGMHATPDNPVEPLPASRVANRQRSYRVLMIAPTSFFADYGCHVRILEEARVLQKLGHCVTVVTYHNGGPVPDLEIARTLAIPWRQDHEVGSSRHKIIFDALLGLRALQLLARRKFDVIHAHLHEGALIGLVLSRIWRLPMVFDFQGSLTGEMQDHGFLRPGSSFYKPLLRLETWLDRAAPAVLTSSAHAQNLLVNAFGCDPTRISLLSDCVNTDVFRPAADFNADALFALRSSLGIPPDRKLVVYLGLLAEYQGISLLLDALTGLLQRRKDVHLLLMGFPRTEHYRQMAAELGIGNHVTLTGKVPYQDAPTYLALGDVAAAPKLSATEGSGKLLNYMAAGLPTVAFDTPVAHEYLGADGLYAIPGDANSLAARLNECLFPSPSMVGRIQQLGWRLRQRAIQRFNWEPIGHQIADVYCRLLGDASGQAAGSQKWSEICIEQGKLR
jgi:glycosyltransferase involved in cell wall biosynthesis